MADWMDELERLAELRDKGLITENEYEAERAKIVPKVEVSPGSIEEEIVVSHDKEVPVETIGKSDLLFSKNTQFALGIVMLSVSILGILVLFLKSDDTFLNQTVNTTRTTIWGFLVVFPALLSSALLLSTENRLSRSRQLSLMAFVAPLSILSFYVLWESITFDSYKRPVSSMKEIGFFTNDSWDEWIAPRILYTLSAALVTALALYAIVKLKDEVTKPKLRRESLALFGTVIFTVGYLFPPITETGSTYYRNDAISMYDYTFSNLRALGNDPSFFKHITDDYGLGIVFPILLLLASLIAISFRRAEVRKAAVGGLIIGLFIFLLNDIIAVASSNLVQYKYINWNYTTLTSMESNLGFSVGFILTVIGSVITLFSLPLEVKQKLIPSNIGRTVPPGRN